MDIPEEEIAVAEGTEAESGDGGGAFDIKALLGKVVTVVWYGALIALVAVGVAAINYFLPEGKFYRGGMRGGQTSEIVKSDFVEMVYEIDPDRRPTAAVENLDAALSLADNTLDGGGGDPDDAIEMIIQSTQATVSGEGEENEEARLEAAEKRIEDLRRLRGEAVVKAMEGLRLRAEPLVAREQYREAAAVYQKYSPPAGSEYLTKATEAERLKLADQYAVLAERHEATAKDAEQRRQQARQKVVAAVVPGVVQGKFDEALADFRRLPAAAEYEDVAAVLEDLAKAESIIIDSFKEDIGKVISVEHRGRQQKLAIRIVENGIIFGEDRVDDLVVGVRIGAKDLSENEKNKRLTGVSRGAKSIFHAIDKLGARQFDEAKRLFKTCQVLGAALAAETDRLVEGEREQAARSRMVWFLKRLNVNSESLEINEVRRELARNSYEEEQCSFILKFVPEYRQRFGETNFHKENGDLLDAAIHRARQRLGEITKQRMGK